MELFGHRVCVSLAWHRTAHLTHLAHQGVLYHSSFKYQGELTRLYTPQELKEIIQLH